MTDVAPREQRPAPRRSVVVKRSVLGITGATGVIVATRAIAVVVGCGVVAIAGCRPREYEEPVPPALAARFWCPSGTTVEKRNSFETDDGPTWPELRCVDADGVPQGPFTVWVPWERGYLITGTYRDGERTGNRYEWDDTTLVISESADRVLRVHFTSAGRIDQFGYGRWHVHLDPEDETPTASVSFDDEDRPVHGTGARVAGKPDGTWRYRDAAGFPAFVLELDRGSLVAIDGRSVPR